MKNYSHKAVLVVTQFLRVGETGAVGPNLASFGDRNRVAGFMDHTEEVIERMDYNTTKIQTRKLDAVIR